jgi:hypothetical protein
MSRGGSDGWFWAGVGIAAALGVGALFFWEYSAGPSAGPWVAFGVIFVLLIVFGISRERRRAG